MPITNDTILEANRKMLGKTNRAVLFAKVNLDEYLDPDVAEDERELTPSLGNMLARINDTSEEQFLTEVREKLTVTSFREFLEKFQPGFYYRVRPAQAATAEGGENAEETFDADSGEAEAKPAGKKGRAKADAEDEAEEATGENESGAEQGGSGAPELEFSLEGGVGWKKVRITSDHPYIRCLSDLIRKRVRQDVSTFRVDVDASLFAFKPKNQRSLMRKQAEDVQVKHERLMLEAKRNPSSKDTARALEAYQSTADDFQTALEDSIRVLPTVVYGLEQTQRELKRLGPSGGTIDPNVYQIEFGTKRSLIASPQKMPQLTALAAGSENDAATKALPSGTVGDQVVQHAIEAGKEEAKTEDAKGHDGKAASGKGALAKTDSKTNGASGALAKKQPEPKRKIAVRTIESALDKMREESARVAQTDYALVPQEKRFPIAVGKFMDKMITRGLIQPLMGNLVATVLQNPKELALLNPDLKDVEFYHDMFLGVYSNAVESFLRTVTPLFETIMGVYLLFNEFPSDVRVSDELKPQLVIANADLPELFLTRQEELKRYFDISCAQATNQFRDAVSFVIVPNVEAFKKKRPAKRKKQASIGLDDDLLASIRQAQSEAKDDADTYGQVTYVDEMLPLLDWGAEYGFQVLFSPEERVRAGRVQREFFQELSDNYAVDAVVERDSADAAVLCLPDFVIMPPDGKLVTGKTADGEIEVGVDVPELTVRACYVAAGRIMANDVPDFLRRKLLKSKKDVATIRPDLPGVSINLASNPFLGETDLPTDHFLNDGVLANLLSPEMPFCVFTHVSGRSPFLSVPRTMRRLHGLDGTQSYRHLHLFRQQVYLNRLLRAAHELGFGGEFPADDAAAEAQMAEFLDYILTWTKWYQPDVLVNSFPSKLQEGKEYTIHRKEGNTFEVEIGFDQGLIAPFSLRF